MGKVDAVASYRDWLREELRGRMAANPRYSLRAFSRDLALHPGRLSSILSGREGLSRTKAEAISRRLGWVGSEGEYFCDLVDSEHARSATQKAMARARIEQRRHLSQHRLSLDAFRIISDWQHLALRELVRSEGFRLDFGKLARSFGLARSVVEESWERLKRLELIWKDEAGRWRASDVLLAPGSVPSSALRNYQAQILSAAQRSLAQDAFEERDHTSTVFLFDPKEMTKAREKIRRFRRETAESLDDPKAKQVYALSIQLFRIADDASVKEKEKT